MQKPTISITKQNGRYNVSVSGKFGGGYSRPGNDLAGAAGMVIRDTPNYDCGKEAINIIVPDEVRAEIDRQLSNGQTLRECLGCPHRQNIGARHERTNIKATPCA